MLQISDKDAARIQELDGIIEQYDLFQYAYKIKLNSAYGAFSNKFFNFYDKRIGESCTATGRMILKHQCAFINELLGGAYDPQGEFVLMGDTDSCCFKTQANNKEDAVLVADEIGNLVNQEYAPFCMRELLIKEQYSSYIKATRELVCSAGIFVAKKHYICHIVDKEGKPADDMKIMGIATKKTSLPRKVSKILNKFLERYIKGEQWHEVCKDILTYKKQMLGSDILSLGMPKGVNDVEKYTADFLKNPKTRLPQHVAGSIFWNICVTQLFPDPEAIKITSGSKVLIFHLHKPYGRFNVICVPQDISMLPKWLTDNFDINPSAQIDRLIEAPLENVMEVCNIKIPSLDDELLEDLLVY